MIQSLALLFSCHFIADFFLQPDWLAKHKRNLFFLALHGVIHATTAYLAFQLWSYWKLPMAILLVHMLIDAIRVRCQDTAIAFAVDQGAHLAGLGGIIWALMKYSGLPVFAGVGSQLIIAVGGFIATVQG